MKLLIANRGEIAIRIAEAASDLGIGTVGIYSSDDARSLHTLRTDEIARLDGSGVGAYLDSDQVLEVATERGCDAIHPGYGFLSENASFARLCSEKGLTFVGPSAETLEIFGDKARARKLAHDLGVAVVPGTSEPVTLDKARDFLAALPAGEAMLIKAVAGGGGRGIRTVSDESDLAAAYERARSEARAACGRPDVFVERFVRRARHVEVPIAADVHGSVACLGDRDCSLQRRHQKVIEIAPAPNLPAGLRLELALAATRLAKASRYRNLGTFEFLVADGEFFFIEANPRLQVEHTVTEEVTGMDIVRLQLQLAQGIKLDRTGASQSAVPPPKGFAIQARINMETMGPDGAARPSGGRLSAFDLPSGRGVRVDTFGYSGYQPSPNFDSLLAKLICHSPDGGYVSAMGRVSRSLRDFRIEGIQTNIGFLQALLSHEDVRQWHVHTRFVDENIKSLLDSDGVESRFFESEESTAAAKGHVGVKVDAGDPLAVLAYGKTESLARRTKQSPEPGPDGVNALRATMQGTIVSVEVGKGAEVRADDLVLVMEAMKMEHEIRSEVGGVVREVTVGVGDTVYEGHPLAYIEERELEALGSGLSEEVDLDHVRPDLAEVHARHAATLDAARPDAVAKRRNTGQRTARENVDDLCDPDSFVEYGQLALTPGTGLPREEVVRRFPADGMITGIGSVNAADFPEEASRCVVLAYDYTVLAGTQGVLNHVKTDRMLELALKWQRPVVLFAEGGGGRAGTGGKRKGGVATTGAGQGRTDDMYRPLDTPSFATMGDLSGLVPLVGITSRYCFAGNASLLGCCDVIIATADSSIGMGGPALIEGGGLGVFRPEEVGPMEIQVPNGVVDLPVRDEAEAVAVAKKYLSYFQGTLPSWKCADQRLLRRAVPENRLRVYKMRDVIHTLADEGSVLELRPEFGPGMITALVRIEGMPVGILANNPQFLSGAIDSDGSDKGARFLQLCDCFDIPIVVLCDTPGMMVGPEIERTALVRHCSRLFVTGANLTVPMITIILRKAYGLGAQAMAGGHTKRPLLTVAWPTAEHGGMGLEGQMKLGFRNELAAISDPEVRKGRYDELVAAAYERGKALNAGVSFAFDDVIDPADTRRTIVRTLESVPRAPARTGKKRPFVDTW